MRYSSSVRFSRAKPTGSFRVLQVSTRRVASHDETLQDARKSAAYWTNAMSSQMEIQERFPSGAWVTVEAVTPKSSARSASKHAHATMKTEDARDLVDAALPQSCFEAPNFEEDTVILKRPLCRGVSETRDPGCGLGSRISALSKQSLRVAVC